MRRFFSCYLPWGIVLSGVLVYLLNLHMHSGKSIAPEIGELGNTFSNSLFQKRFSMGNVTIWSDITDSAMLMEHSGKLLAVLTNVGEKPHMEVFRKKKPTLNIIFSETNSPLALKVSDDESSCLWWVFDNDWSGVPDRRVVLPNGFVANSTVEEFVGGHWQAPNSGNSSKETNPDSQP